MINTQVMNGVLEVHDSKPWNGKVSTQSYYIGKANSIKFYLGDGKVMTTTWDKGFKMGENPRMYKKDGVDDYYLLYFQIKPDCP